MQHSLLRVLGFLIILGALAPAAIVGQVCLVYSQSTGSQQDRVEITDQTLPTGALLGIAISNGETYRIETDASEGVIACSFEFPSEGTTWNAVREGTTLRLVGTVQHRPVSRIFRIDSHPWYESAERSLQHYAISAPPRAGAVLDGRAIRGHRIPHGGTNRAA